jgi:DinB superfamily
MSTWPTWRATMGQMLRDNGPHLGRYRAEEDAAWPEWACLSTEEVLHRLKALRAEIMQHIAGLSEADATRVGFHPLFGAMSVALWVEFFLLHEAHHLYMIMTRLGQAKRARRS